LPPPPALLGLGCASFFLLRAASSIWEGRVVLFFLLRARGAGASVVFLLQAVHLVQGYFCPTAEKLTSWIWFLTVEANRMDGGVK
jgi:hypothetical protein